MPWLVLKLPEFLELAANSVPSCASRASAVNNFVLLRLAFVQRDSHCDGAPVPADNACHRVTYQLATQHAAHTAIGASVRGAAKLGQRVHARAIPLCQNDSCRMCAKHTSQ